MDEAFLSYVGRVGVNHETFEQLPLSLKFFLFDQFNKTKQASESKKLPLLINEHSTTGPEPSLPSLFGEDQCMGSPTQTSQNHMRSAATQFALLSPSGSELTHTPVQHNFTQDSKSATQFALLSPSSSELPHTPVQQYKHANQIGSEYVHTPVQPANLFGFKASESPRVTSLKRQRDIAVEEQTFQKDAFTRLIQSARYAEAILIIKALRHVRKRVSFPEPNIRYSAKFLDGFTSEGELWFERLIGVIGFTATEVPVAQISSPRLEGDFTQNETNTSVDSDDSFPSPESSDNESIVSSVFSDDDDGQLFNYQISSDELFNEIMTPDNLDLFVTFLREQDPRLSASTVRKGLFSLTTGVQRAFGKNLSKLLSRPELKTKARSMLDKLADLTHDFRDEANVEENRTHCARIQYSAATAPPTLMMKSLYFIFIVQGFKAHSMLLKADTLNSVDADWFCGYTIFALLLGRPCSRKQIFDNLTLTQVQNLNLDKPLLLTFASHKNARSAGALVAQIPCYTLEILAMYLKKVRPFLCTNHTFSSDALLPENWPNLFEKFLISAGFPKHKTLPPGSLRKIFCDSIGEIPPHNRFRAYASDLQVCAGHSVKGKIIENFYELRAILDREQILREFVFESFISPNLEEIQSFSSAVFPRSLSDSPLLSSPQPVSKRVCQNRARGKKCHSKRRMAPVFSTGDSMHCQACEAKYQGTGAWRSDNKKHRT